MRLARLTDLAPRVKYIAFSGGVADGVRGNFGCPQCEVHDCKKDLCLLSHQWQIHALRKEFTSSIFKLKDSFKLSDWCCVGRSGKV